MCGIAGQVTRGDGTGVDEGLLRRMCRRMMHRGPDDEGLHVEGCVGLAMRRLQVIDLAGGQQPMSNEDDSLWLVFNGEIYNYRELRVQLQRRGHVLRTDSDTETILHLYEEKGIDCLLDLRGMFALALWDSRRQQLLLARDRIGKKPLYYSVGETGLTFASELSALMCDPSISRELDPAAIDEYLRYLFVPHPRSIYRDVCKLPPGSHALYRAGTLSVRRYWTVDYSPAPVRGDEVARLTELLQEAVRLRLLADVPLGAFLSGGLDSSLVVALMQRVSNRTVRTFAVGFEDATFSELGHARTVADALETEHEEVIVDYGVDELIPRLADHFGEPFADSSAIPMYHLSRVARDHVTVALSGDGGDEVFGGYRRYRAGQWARVYNRWPHWGGRGLFETAVRQLPDPAVYYGSSLRKKARRFVEFAGARRQSPEASWDFFFLDEERRGLYRPEMCSRLAAVTAPGSYAGYGNSQAARTEQGMLWFDLMTYLPDDILTKVDRMSMAVSLEARAPLLDQEVVAFAAGLPRSMKFGLCHSKVILRQAARRLVPESILQRPKQGFAIPLARWLKEDLHDWARDLLTGAERRSAVLFDDATLAHMLAVHQQGQRDLSQQLWALLMLEAWMQHAEAQA